MTYIGRELLLTLQHPSDPVLVIIQRICKLGHLCIHTRLRQSHPLHIAGSEFPHLLCKISDLSDEKTRK